MLLIISSTGLQRLAMLAQDRAVVEAVEAAKSGASPSTGMSHANIRSRLQSALSHAHSTATAASASYQPSPYVTDLYGDHAKGHVVTETGGKFHKRPYAIDEAAPGKIKFGTPTPVFPRTTYDDAECMSDAAPGGTFGVLSEAALDLVANVMNVTERAIPQADRDKMDPADFAGKGTSFPIQKPGDVTAAVHALGRAGADNYSHARIKSNITRIAGRKGWHGELPGDWLHNGKDPDHSDPEGAADTKEADESTAALADVVSITESATPADYDVESTLVRVREGAVGQDGSARIKIIRPGWGSGVNSSGMNSYYPASVLESDGPKIFKRGLKMFWDHPTATEEAERPEGTLTRLAATLTSDAKWEPRGTDGPGLYATINVKKEFREAVDDLAPDIGVSIRASAAGAVGKVNGKEGVIISRFIRAKSTDFVTSPGAGGKVLSLFESARGSATTTLSPTSPIITPQITQESNMTEAQAKELQDLRESQAATTSLLTNLQMSGARDRAEQYARGALDRYKLKPPMVAKLAIALRESAPIDATKGFSLDVAKFDTMIKEAATAEITYVTEITGRVPSGSGFGTTSTEITGTGTAKDDKVTLAEADAEFESILTGWGHEPGAAKKAATL